MTDRVTEALQNRGEPHVGEHTQPHRRDTVAAGSPQRAKPVVQLVASDESVALGRVDGVLDGAKTHYRTEIDQRARHRRDGDAVDLTAVHCAEASTFCPWLSH